MSDTAVVTVTANPAVDQTIWIPGFRAGQVNRVVREDRSPGGKGINVAAFLAAFGVPVRATGFLGADNAAPFSDFLTTAGIEQRFTLVEGVTRTGVKIVDDAAGETTDINFPGFTVTAAERERVGAEVAAAVTPGGWVVLAGSLPQGVEPDLYRWLTELVHAGGGLVALDTSGPALERALPAGPDLIKPNRAELEELTGRVLGSRDDVLAAARELLAAGAGLVIVSDGAAGALFARGDEAVFATPPPVTVASTVGAGDAMVAGAVAGLRERRSLADVAALATAFSAVAISRVGPHLDADEVHRTVTTIEVEQL